MPHNPSHSDDTLPRRVDTPAYLTLKEACEVFFGGRIKPASLRAEAKRGRLQISRVGRTDFVSPEAIKTMMETACLDDANLRDSTSEMMSRSGSSEMDRKRSALAAALQTAKELKRRLPPTSRASSLP